MKNFTQNVVLILAAVLVMSLFSGCAATWEGLGFKKDASAKADDKKEQEVKKVGEDLLKTFVKNDADGFLKLLPEVVRDEFGVNGFKKTRESMIEQLGTPVSYEFVLNLEHPTFTVSVWKVTYERKSSDQKRTIRQESLFRAVSGKVDGQDKLLAFNFL